MPKNLVKASLRDVKRNACPLHENVQRAARALNRFFCMNKTGELCIPSSTIDACLCIICNPSPENEGLNRNPLNWKPECTKGECEQCKHVQWHENLLHQIEERELQNKIISYTQWVSEKDCKNNKQILQKNKCSVILFINDILLASIWSTRKFPEHLRKAWNQWQITKYPIVVSSMFTKDVAIRTREDYQEDLKFLCTSETVYSPGSRCHHHGLLSRCNRNLQSGRK